MEQNCYRIADAGILRMFPTDRFKTGTLSVLTVLPVDAERSPLVRLLLAVLGRGTETYPTMEALNRRLDDLYASGVSIRCTRYGDSQIIGLRGNFLDDGYVPDGTDVMDGVLEVMDSMLFHPLMKDGLLSEEYVRSEVSVLTDALTAERSNPQAYALMRFRQIMGKGDPFSVSMLGTPEFASRVNTAELTEEYRLLTGDGLRMRGVPLDFVYTGNAGTDRIREKLEHWYGRYHAGEVWHVPTRVFSGKRTPKRVDEEMPVRQSRLLIGLSVGVSLTDTSFYAMLVANEILGVSPVSKLFVNVRERKSLCYHCASSYDFYKGIIVISAGIRECDREAAELAIFEQIDAMKRGDISDAEIDAAKKSLENAYRQIPDNPGAMEGYAYGRALFGVSVSVEETMRRFCAVGRDEIVRAADRMSVDTVYFLRGTRGDGEDDDVECESGD